MTPEYSQALKFGLTAICRSCHVQELLGFGSVEWFVLDASRFYAS